MKVLGVTLGSKVCPCLYGLEKGSDINNLIRHDFLDVTGFYLFRRLHVMMVWERRFFQGFFLLF